MQETRGDWFIVLQKIAEATVTRIDLFVVGLDKIDLTNWMLFDRQLI